jgi:hypothetical protein
LYDQEISIGCSIERLDEDYDSLHLVWAMKELNMFLDKVLARREEIFANPVARDWLIAFITPVKEIDLRDPINAKIVQKLPYTVS